MTGKERLTAAINGEPVDRVPIWLREGFPVGGKLPPADDFGCGWMQDPVYRQLFEYVEPHADPIFGWGAFGPWPNRFLMIPPGAIHWEPAKASGDLRRSTVTVDTPRGTLTAVNEQRRGQATSWHVKTLVESVDDLVKLSEIPWELDTSFVEGALENYEKALAAAGDRGVLQCGLSSPIVVISGCMKLQLFLELSYTHKSLFHELLAEITRRSLAVMDAVFKGRTLDTTMNVGGSEQCTPPMMPPEAFDEYVAPYDGPIVARAREYGIPMNCHCHGKISRALQCMVDMGIASTDPVEPPPAGDVTYEEARAIADGKVTLVGNLEFDELCFADADHIRRRVRDLLSHGKDRLILGASAGPCEAVTPRLAENVRAWVDTALECG